MLIPVISKDGKEICKVERISTDTYPYFELKFPNVGYKIKSKKFQLEKNEDGTRYYKEV